MTRGGRVKARDEPERRCIVTRETGPKAGLIRFVAGPGRRRSCPTSPSGCRAAGMWVSADARGAARRRPARALRPCRRSGRSGCPPTSPTGSRRCSRRGSIELARAGAQGRPGGGGAREDEGGAGLAARRVLLHAGGGRTARERGQACGRRTARTALVSCLFGHELGLAFGRERVIHAAVLAGGLGDRMRDEALRLSGIRDCDEPPRLRMRRTRSATDRRRKASAGKARTE